MEHFTSSSTFSDRIDRSKYTTGQTTLDHLITLAQLSEQDRESICATATELVERIRSTTEPGLMEVFLAEYGLSTDEGVALMCLAEALLRVPDAETIDDLIEDKIAPSDWGRHLGQSASSLVNASTWALMLTGRLLDEAEPGPVRHIQAVLKRVGEPVIRTAVTRAMKEMGRQFVLGEDIQGAMQRAQKMQQNGYTYSYDMLGEAACTEADAKRYHLSYSRAISAIATDCTNDDIRANPGISVKLSALHPRYEIAQSGTVMSELVPRLRSLALLAKSAGMGLNIDAEEADRLTLSLEVINTVLSDPALSGWDGFGVVVQAYGPRTSHVIDALYEMAKRYDRKLMVRLVKGAYWDTEIKRAQVAGLDGFPVFTSKATTDVSYIANARKLLGLTDRLYPQFASHNAHTVAAILHMADGSRDTFEFQRLHGMGETLHDIVFRTHKTACRIYAPVGAHRDLLAYLVRRLLENGANSSFVNQIVDETVPPKIVAADPFTALENQSNSNIKNGSELFEPERLNSRGFDLSHAPTLDALFAARRTFETHHWVAKPVLASSETSAGKTGIKITNPADLKDVVGEVYVASSRDVEAAFQSARPWGKSLEQRSQVLLTAAEALEASSGEVFALLAREAGKSIPDCVAEVREAVDFLRYYAAQASEVSGTGIYVCISPWNFPLAIFLGQISAALAAGNAVLAKPAEQTPLIAHLAVSVLHDAGVPRAALQLLPGAGDVGAMLTSDSRVSGVAFTGSTDTARRIRLAMAQHVEPGAPLIAETGGLNAMIVDSTALPDQAIQAVIESAFQSAGQRCSALRCLYVQRDIADHFIPMLMGAMEALQTGRPWNLSTDVGPVIDAAARTAINEHISKARIEGRVLLELSAPATGHFVGPTLIRVNSICELEREVFGPVLHVATYEAQALDQIIDDINATGYGLTFGLQTRIDDRVQYVSERIAAGNLYINRNQIGAIVGSQPFGGEGLSGTGPKAGGPHYLLRFAATEREWSSEKWDQISDSLPDLPSGERLTPFQTHSLPGPTGESNRLSTYPRTALLCLGPGQRTARAQAEAVRALGGMAVEAAGEIDPRALATGPQYGGVLWWGDGEKARAYSLALADRTGPIIPLITSYPDQAHVLMERHICVDTTASGGNAALLGSAS